MYRHGSAKAAFLKGGFQCVLLATTLVCLTSHVLAQVQSGTAPQTSVGQSTTGAGNLPTGQPPPVGNQQSVVPSSPSPVVVVQPAIQAPASSFAGWNVITLIAAAIAVALTIYNFLGGRSIKDVRSEFERKKEDFEGEVKEVKKDFTDYRNEFREARKELRERFEELRNEVGQLVTRHKAELDNLEKKNKEQDELQKSLEAALNSLSAQRALEYIRGHQDFDSVTKQRLHREAESYLMKVVDSPELIKDARQLFHSYAQLGYVHKRLQNVDLALNFAERALGLDPDDPAVLFNAGCYSALCQKHDNALRFLEEAFKRIPSWTRDASEEADLSKLRLDSRFGDLVRRYSPESVSN